MPMKTKRQLQTRDIALISLATAVTIALNLTFYYAFFFLFLVLLFILGKRRGCLYALFVATINFFAGMTLLTFLNIGLLPLTAFILVIGKDFLLQPRPMRPTTQAKLTYFIFSAVVIMLSNCFYALVTMFYYKLSSAYFFQVLPLNLGGAVLNAAIFSLIGYAIVERCYPIANPK